MALRWVGEDEGMRVCARMLGRLGVPDVKKGTRVVLHTLTYRRDSDTADVAEPELVKDHRATLPAPNKNRARESGPLEVRQPGEDSGHGNRQKTREPEDKEKLVSQIFQKKTVWGHFQDIFAAAAEDILVQDIFAPAGRHIARVGLQQNTPLPHASDGGTVPKRPRKGGLYD
ncbi:hypothetical protein HK104_004173 [Borealophlyctis nickersoniae]|nr:hypothetical protein HK104_004173 [Borealophlyctis nickersoniae]